jgi:LL-diaminopimelate aminotransferase
VGFRAKKPAASFFLYVRAPKGLVGGQRFANGEDFQSVPDSRKLICTVPWDDAGPYIRLSVTFSAATPEEENG